MVYEGVVVFYLISLTLSVFLLIYSVNQIGFIRRIAISFSLFIISLTLILMFLTMLKAYKFKGSVSPISSFNYDKTPIVYKLKM